MESGVIATYSGTGAVTMLECVVPARVEGAGVQLVGEPLQTVAERLGATGVQMWFDDLGAQIPSLAVGLFAPAGVVEGVQLGSD